MKNILDFKLFEKVEKPIKIDDFLLKKLNKGKSIGAITDFEFDLKNMKLYITFHDGSEMIKGLKLHDFIYRDFSKGERRIKLVPKITFEETYNDDKHSFTSGCQRAEKFWNEFNAKEKAFIKSSATKTITHNGKEYSISQLYTELLPNSEIYQKIIEHNYVNITTAAEKKNGTVTIEKNKGVFNIPGPYNYTDPPYKITKNGKIYKMSSHSLTVQSYKPLTTFADYEKCLNWIYDNVYKKEIEEEIQFWKDKIAENPKKLVKLAGEMPVYISKMLLSPKLHNLKKTGLFDND